MLAISSARCSIEEDVVISGATTVLLVVSGRSLIDGLCVRTREVLALNSSQTSAKMAEIAAEFGDEDEESTDEEEAQGGQGGGREDEYTKMLREKKKVAREEAAAAAAQQEEEEQAAAARAEEQVGFPLFVCDFQ